MLRLQLSTVDYLILAIYLLLVIGIGFVARMSIRTDLDFSFPGARCRHG
jgi:SSS family solute:Na+ symporter